MNHPAIKKKKSSKVSDRAKTGGAKKQQGQKRRGSAGKEAPTTKKSRESRSTTNSVGTGKEKPRIEGDNGDGKCGYDHTDINSYMMYDHPGYWGPKGAFENDKCRKCTGKVKAVKGSSIKRCKGFDVCKLMWCGETTCFAESRAMKALMKSDNKGGRSTRTTRKVWSKAIVG